MKILAFTDTHGSKRALTKVKEKAKKADIVICAGDITIFSQDLDKILKELNKLKKPVLIIPGNHELQEEIKHAASKLDNIYPIHNSKFKFNDVLFIGYEGDGFSLKDSGFRKASKKFEKWVKKHEKVILVTHAPPYGTKLDQLMDDYCGNKDIRKFIEKHDIKIAISGHIHENEGKRDKIKNTVVINPGPFGKIINI
ncbi:metallophosphoesterase [Candidatus Woesearchaeota archaeon]|nr:metallophosphoesterase [Candidatus Woesearchaeota archaeon]